MVSFFGKTNIDFISPKKRYIAYAFSIIVIIVGFISFLIKGPQYGIDFTGGLAIRLKFSGAYSLEKIRSILKEINLGDSIIQKIGKEDEVLIRVKEVEEIKEKPGETLSFKILNILTERLNSAEDLKNKIDLNSIRDTSLLQEELKLLSQENMNWAEITNQIIIYQNTHGGVFKNFDELKVINGLSSAMINKMKEKFYLGAFILRSSSKVGPTVGKTLQWQAIISVFLAMIAILIYVGLRFEFKLAVAADLALLHDVLVALSFVSLTNCEINVPIISVLLMIVGYSINDTIVLFDRLRENLKIYKKEPFEKIINNSINDTLSRTIITSLTVFFVVLTLFLFGGEVLHDFAFTLLVGIIAGSYSTIYIASPILIDWKNWELKKEKK